MGASVKMISRCRVFACKMVPVTDFGPAETGAQMAWQTKTELRLTFNYQNENRAHLTPTPRTIMSPADSMTAKTETPAAQKAGMRQTREYPTHVIDPNWRFALPLTSNT